MTFHRCPPGLCHLYPETRRASSAQQRRLHQTPRSPITIRHPCFSYYLQCSRGSSLQSEDKKLRDGDSLGSSAIVAHLSFGFSFNDTGRCLPTSRTLMGKPSQETSNPRGLQEAAKLPGWSPPTKTTFRGHIHKISFK